MGKAVFALLAVCLVSGCTVYKSSDRDDFNSNGKARAPAQKATQAPLGAEDQALLADPCAALAELSGENIARTFGSAPKLSMTNQISPKTSTCLVTNEEAPQDLAAFTVITCSWKPADGQLIDQMTPDASDTMSPQTTEDDLRESGLDVVSASVTSGATLRMNCEGYASTAALINDRRLNEERGRNDLASQFATFALELKRATLSSDARP